MSVDKRYIEYVLESSKRSDDDLYIDISVAWNENLYLMQVEHHKKNNLPPPPIGAMGSDTGFGKKLYTDCKDKLKDAFCDTTKGRPKPYIADLMDSDYKELILAIITTIVSTLETTLAIAAPLAALIIKHGLHKLCSVENN